MKFSVDRIENNIAILENINSKEKKELNTSILPKDIKEGTILEFNNNNFEIDEQAESIRRQRIIEKFNKLKK